MKIGFILINSVLLMLLSACSTENRTQLSTPILTTSLPDSSFARNFVLIIDRDDSSVPTPINNAYCNAINMTGENDEIFAFQKYFRNKRINDALIAAAGMR